MHIDIWNKIAILIIPERAKSALMSCAGWEVGGLVTLTQSRYQLSDMMGVGVGGMLFFLKKQCNVLLIHPLVHL